MLEELIDALVENPTEENKNQYFIAINEEEHRLLKKAHEHPLKSREFFAQRSRAFAIRRESAMRLISKWVAKYGSTENSPVSYADTLNIPFQQIK